MEGSVGETGTKQGSCSVQELAGQLLLCLSSARLYSAGQNLFESLTTARALHLNRFDRRRPDEGLGILIPRSQILRDRILHLCNAAERASPHSLGGHVPKLALTEIASTGTGRHNVRDDARMPCDPGFYAGTRVRALVVRHQVHGDIAWTRLGQPA